MLFVRKSRQKLAEWLREYKKSLKCSNCPESHPATLEFHHKDPSQKTITISRMCTNIGSKKRILDEISKCIVLCANCHRKLHFPV
jgi:protein-arginine kinase activator protein McsA